MCTVQRMAVMFNSALELWCVDHARRVAACSSLFLPIPQPYCSGSSPPCSCDPFLAGIQLALNSKEAGPDKVDRSCAYHSGFRCVERGIAVVWNLGIQGSKRGWLKFRYCDSQVREAHDMRRPTLPACLVIHPAQRKATQPGHSM